MLAHPLARLLAFLHALVGIHRDPLEAMRDRTAATVAFERRLLKPRWPRD